MTNVELVTVAELRLMQGLAQRVTATRPELVNADATFGELAWTWGKGQGGDGKGGHVGCGSRVRSWWRGAGPGCRGRSGGTTVR
ncbi:hypothetical protein N7U49_14905 [Streptomyces sp. AD2-2]|nr:hypothetical protein N7U49_14905 [Streptomyces sp. AD2-2]